MQVSIKGFKAIKSECFIAALTWMNDVGTCCLAYGDWTVKGYELLLTAEQQNFHSTDTALDEAWCDLDTEICEALIMLPVLNNTASNSIYWNGNGQFSNKDFPDAEYGVEFIEE